MRTRRALVGGLLVVLVAGVAATGGYALRQHPAPAAAKVRVDPTVTVRRGDLNQVQRLTGRLGYAGSRTVTGTDTGILTWLPSVGRTVHRGGQLFRVNDAPVTVLYGDLPLYRTLGVPPGSDDGTDHAGTDHKDAHDKHGGPPLPPVTGHDVDLVAANLAALGFWHGSTTGLSYQALTPAVKAWQTSLGEEPTGVLQPGSVVVTRGPVRVLGVLAQVGASAAQDVVKVTSTRRRITLKAPPSLAPSLSPGRRVRVRLANGRTLATRIAHIGAEDDAGNAEPSLPVVVTPVRRAKLRTAELGAVSADLVTASRKGVLHVPVNALLALSGGGYALERPDHTLVRVNLGLIAGGEAQVSGIEAGARVVVAR